MSQTDAAKTDDRRRREDALDEALAQSFPASDPPSALAPHPAAPDEATGRGRGRGRGGEKDEAAGG